MVASDTHISQVAVIGLRWGVENTNIEKTWSQILSCLNTDNVQARTVHAVGATQSKGKLVTVECYLELIIQKPLFQMIYTY